MNLYKRILLQNKKWAIKKADEDIYYFNELIHLQTPEILWIGCTENRVPVEEITGTEPGEIFVHHNIANMVVHNDANLMSVLYYSMTYLRINHIIICGHYSCGGIQSAMKKSSYGVIRRWLQYVRNLSFHRHNASKGIADQEQTNRLVELNVRDQVINLARTSIIQKVWSKEQRPHLHGLVYNPQNGILKPVFEMEPGSKVDEIVQIN
jgi:carbonic anhydrase